MDMQQLSFPVFHLGQDEQSGSSYRCFIYDALCLKLFPDNTIAHVASKTPKTYLVVLSHLHVNKC